MGERSCPQDSVEGSSLLHHTRSFCLVQEEKVGEKQAGAWVIHLSLTTR